MTDEVPTVEELLALGDLEKQTVGCRIVLEV